jgi:hypothetical protein
MHARNTAWIGGAAVLATWFVAAAGQNGPLTGAPTPPSAPPGESATELAARDIEAQAARLRARLGAAPRPADAARNPFLFVERAASQSRRLAPPAAVVDDPASAPMPEPDPFTLSGIATDDGADGPVRTAVLSGLGDVFLARAGDIVMARYEVVAVGADAVHLRDLTTGRNFRIGLR